MINNELRASIEAAMNRRYFSHVLLGILTISGCISMSPEEISRDRVLPDERMIREVVTVDGTAYTFAGSADGYGRLIDSTIVGKLDNGKLIKIHFSSVRRIYVMRVNAGESASASGFVVGLVVLAAAVFVASISKMF